MLVFTVPPFLKLNTKTQHEPWSTLKELLVEKGVLRHFGLAISVTQFSVSITHNSKMVEPMTKRLFGKR